MNKHYGLTLLIAATCGMAGAAAAQEGPDSLEMRSAAVSYDAAKTHDAKSAEKLFFGIRQAAEEVCRISSYPRGYEIWQEHACETEAVAQAVREAGVPALDEYYFGSAGVALASSR